MIGRTNRFHGRGSIQRLYRTSKSVRGGFLSLRYAPTGAKSSYRVAVVASRKVSKSAVVRNRIRRRIYENVRILSSCFIAPCDLVFVVYDERIADLPAAQLHAEIQQLCKKAKLTSANAVPRAIVKTKEL